MRGSPRRVRPARAPPRAARLGDGREHREIDAGREQGEPRDQIALLGGERAGVSVEHPEEPAGLGIVPRRGLQGDGAGERRVAPEEGARVGPHHGHRERVAAHPIEQRRELAGAAREPPAAQQLQALGLGEGVEAQGAEAGCPSGPRGR